VHNGDVNAAAGMGCVCGGSIRSTSPPVSVAVGGVMANELLVYSLGPFLRVEIRG
jgi:hypothetical protein